MVRGEERADGFFVRNKSALYMGLAALVIAGTADLVAGFFMVSMEDYILMVPGMMVLIYAAIGMRGNIFGAMGSRLGTAMHIGTFQLSFRKKSVLRSNIEAAMALTLAMSVLMALIGWVIVWILFDNTYDFLKFMFISTFGGLLAGVLVMVVNIAVAYIGYRRNWDVDNITAPLIAAAGDVITVPMIYTATLMAVNLEDMITQIGAIVLIAVTVLVVARIVTRKSKRKRKVDEAKRIVVQSMPVLLGCIVLELATGVLIEHEEARFIEYAVLLLMITAFLNEGNALSGMLTSRLSSMFHMGTLPRTRFPPRETIDNYLIMYILALITFMYIMGIAFVCQPNDMEFMTLVAIVFVAAMIITTVINFLSYYVALAALRFNLDPDDHCIPITSSIMDVVSTVVLVAVIGIFI